MTKIKKLQKSKDIIDILHSEYKATALLVHFATRPTTYSKIVILSSFFRA